MKECFWQSDRAAAITLCKTDVGTQPEKLEHFFSEIRFSRNFWAMIVTVCYMEKFSGYSLFKIPGKTFGLGLVISFAEIDRVYIHRNHLGASFPTVSVIFNIYDK